MDYPIASDLSQRVLEKRNGKVQLPAATFDEAHESSDARVDAVPGDRPTIRDSFQGEGFERQRLMLGRR
jgi:hypothetical protein